MDSISGKTDNSSNRGKYGFTRSTEAGVSIALCFTLSMLLSALLLFFVQPMFAKMALPLLGGSSGVWNTAMVFFQSVLLLGYLYAHLLSRFFRFYHQVLIHGFVMSAALFFLPIAIPEGISVPQSGTPTLWLLGLFGVALGIPFFALSANAPLLQKWFSYTNHRSAADPYFLYAASNAGSLLSLLSYPVLVEPFFALSGQSYAWTVGFMVLILMIVGSGFVSQGFTSVSSASGGEETKVAPKLTWMRRASWVGFSLVPSSLMLGVTAHLTSNVASAPFLWVLPLALYLLTFIVAFSPKPLVPHRWIENGFPFVAAAALLLVSIRLDSFVVDITANLFCFYIITQMCHNRLAQDRPHSENLTEFYFFMSLGGVVGGAITALAAPLLFNDVYEYHIIIAFAGLVAAGAFPKWEEMPREFVTAACVIGFAVLFLFLSDLVPGSLRGNAFVIVVSLLAAGIIINRKLPLRLFVHLAAIALLMINVRGIVSDDDKRVIYSERSFFGVSKVIYQDTENGPLHIFQHGNTKHNVQLRAAEALDYPLAYYSPEGSFGQTVDAMRAARQDMSVAVIGLGAGAMACHVKDNESWKFYEIDPLVVDMARTQNLFTYVNNCAPQSPIVIGDARLTLEKEKAASFDLIMIDAFSSNVIPAHLVTIEALELYRSKLKEGGVVFFHTSNRHLDVSSVVLNVAEASGLATRFITTKKDESIKYHGQVSDSSAILVGESDEALDLLLADYPEWKQKDGSDIVGVWRDDFSHVLGALMATYTSKQK